MSPAAASSTARGRARFLPGFAFFALAFLLRAPFLSVRFAPWDESYYASVARMTAEGSRLYSELGYLRPPGLNLAYETAYRLSGFTGLPYDFTVRLLSTLAVAAAVGLLGQYLFRRLGPLPTAIACGLAALMSASMTLQNEANSETWMMLPYTASAVLVLLAAEVRTGRRRTALVLAAGALTAAAALFKEVALVGLALPLGAVFVSPRRGREWLTDIALFFGGAAAAGALTIGILAVTGEAVPYLYYTWFTRLLYVSGTQERVGPLAILRPQLTLVRDALVIPLCLATAGGVAALTTGRSRTEGSRAARGLVAFAFVWLAVSAVGVAASGRYYQHYFIQMTIPLALLAGAAARLAMSSSAVRVRGVIAGLIALALVPATLSYGKDLGDPGGWYEWRETWPAVAGRVDELTPDSGSYLVWGPLAGVRAYAGARPATSVAWVYYPFDAPGGRQALGRRFPSYGDMVVADIEKDPPDTIVLTAELGEYLPGAQVSSVDPPDDRRIEHAIASMLSTDFTEAERGEGYVIFVRTDRNDRKQ